MASTSPLAARRSSRDGPNSPSAAEEFAIELSPGDDDALFDLGGGTPPVVLHDDIDPEAGGTRSGRHSRSQSHSGDEREGPDHRPPPPARGVRAAAEQAVKPIAWWQRRRVQGAVACLVLLLVVALVASFFGGSRGAGKYPLRHLSIARSAHDTRSYRFLQLSANSLPVLLVHDAATDSAAASVAVGVGSSSDPPAREGLAHFLEHMLFMGSTPFPDEHEYSSYLAAHGGNSNAYTADESTVYFMDVQPDAFAGALARFAGFFTSPLLSASGAFREMHAVDSEHRKNVLDDGWRSAQLLRVSSSPQSEFNHFGTGTIDSLNGSSIVADLRAFHAQHYKASNMYLVLLGRESLADLENMVEGLFASVPGQALPQRKPAVDCSGANNLEDDYEGGEPDGSEGVDDAEQTTLSHPSGSGRIGSSRDHESVQLATLEQQRICVVQQQGWIPPSDGLPFDSPFDPSLVSPFLPFVRESVSRNITFVPVNAPAHTMALYFPLPSSLAPLPPPSQSFAQDPAGFLSYVLGHEGSPSTLCAALKRKGWARSVQVGTAFDSRRMDQALLAIEIQLTDEGNAPDTRAKVVDAVFEYVQLVRDQPWAPAAIDEPHSGLQQLYDTMQSESSLRFLFQEKDRPISYASMLSARMAELLPLGLPVEHILLPPNLVHAYGDGSAIQRALTYLTRKNVLLMYSSSDLQGAEARESVAPASEWEREAWYGIEYVAAPLDESFLTATDSASASSSSSGLALDLPPASNPFLPTDFAVLPVASLVAAINSGDLTASAKLRTIIGKFDVSSSIPLSLPLVRSDGTSVSGSHKLYYLPDLRGFNLPYASFAVLLRFSPGFLAEPGAEGTRRQVSLQLYFAALDEILQAPRYELQQLNMDFALELHPGKQGITLTLAGFGSNIANVWEQLLPSLLALDDPEKISDARLGQLKEDILQGVYESYPSSLQPYQHALDFQRVWEERSRRSMPELEGALRSPESRTDSREDLATFVRQALQRVSIVGLAYGNIDSATAQGMHASTIAFLEGQGLGAELSTEELQSIDKLSAREVYRFGSNSSDATMSNAAATTPAPGSSFVFRHAVLNPVELNSALVFNVQLGPTGGDSLEGSDAVDSPLRKGVLLALLSQWLGEAAFNVLRTQWALGYMVWGQVRESLAGGGLGGSASSSQQQQQQQQLGVSNFVFIIQNAALSPRVLEARVESFLLRFRTGQLAGLTDEDLDAAKDTLATTLRVARDARRSMSAQFAHAWRSIVRGPAAPDAVPAFGREDAQLSILASITLADLRTFFDTYFLSMETRRKSAVLVYGAAHNATADDDEAAAAAAAAGQEDEAAAAAVLLERLRFDCALPDLEQRASTRAEEQWGTWP